MSTPKDLYVYASISGAERAVKADVLKQFLCKYVKKKERKTVIEWDKTQKGDILNHNDL